MNQIKVGGNMGISFYKKLPLAKGVNLNVSKSGLSLSLKVGNVTLNSRGRVTANLGNGVRYTKNLKKVSKKKSNK